jgi:riboflavin kinase/FMN adenylyltransferase
VIEVNIFDFDEDIYAETLQVELHHFIREDLPFKGLEELTVQLKKDKEATLAKLEAGNTN